MSKLFYVGLLLLAGGSRGAEAPPGTVTLPLSEYERLLDRSARPPRRPEPPPLPAVLARAEARAAVAAGRARGTLVIEGEVFAAGTTRVPLVAGATVVDVRSSGRPVPLAGEGGTLAALLPGGRPFSLQLDWAAPVASEPGRASFSLPSPRAGSVKALIEVPGEQADVRVEPGLVTRRSAGRGLTQVEATLVPGSNARVSWSAREAASSARREARLLADVKTLVSVGEAELQLAALVDVAVVEGEPERFGLELPGGWELVGVSGPTLDSTAEAGGALQLVVREPGRRRHQFLVSLQRPVEPGTAPAADAVPFVAVRGAERESGELAVAGLGTLEIAAREGGSLRRMDVGEAAPALRSLTAEPLLHAFRYQRRGAETPELTLEVRRFEPQAVLAALCERAVATTLVTAEGRTLTELRLRVRNQAQPFLKVGLAPGASLLSAEVAGQAVKPVQADDGTRVPLLRAGFRPSGPYEVSFVWLQPGTALGRRGEAGLGLPRLDLPVSLLEWELFLPDRYEVKRFEGDVQRQEELSVLTGIEETKLGSLVGGVAGGRLAGPATASEFAANGAPAGVAAPPAAGPVRELVEVAGASPDLSDGGRKELESRSAQLQNAPSQNVFALQRRVAGVLPVRVDVPHAGGSFRFVRALVLDEETAVRFRYKARRR